MQLLVDSASLPSAFTSDFTQILVSDLQQSPAGSGVDVEISCMTVSSLSSRRLLSQRFHLTQATSSVQFYINNPQQNGSTDEVSALFNQLQTDVADPTSSLNTEASNNNYPINTAFTPTAMSVCPDGSQVELNQLNDCPSNNGGGSGLSNGAIAGIVVGSVIGGLIVICLLVLCCVYLINRNYSVNQGTPVATPDNFAANKAKPHPEYAQPEKTTNEDGSDDELEMVNVS